MKKKIVVALGGNALLKKGSTGDIKEQFRNTTEALEEGVMPLIKKGHNVVITHGNGPVVGHIALRVEAGLKLNAPYMPLDICGADSQGGIGYMIEMCMRNLLLKHKIKRSVATLVTPVLVSKDDESFKNPTKPIGNFYTKEDAERLAKEHDDWTVKEDAGRGWRRVVPSPKPLEIINNKAVQEMVDHGFITIAAGGGGVPVIKEDGTLKGVSAVIDKDLTAAVLANNIKADLLMILTAVDKVALDYNKPAQKNLDSMTLKEAKKYLAEGQFPAGSMGPKIEAAINFIQAGGKEVIICANEKAHLALDGKAGTRIVKK